MKESITSHHLMVFMGSFYTNNLEVNNDFITYERNPKANYRLYMDLETEDIIKVLKDNILKFEEENITLYLPILKYSKEEYCKSFKKLQNWFKEQIVNHPLEDVIKEIKSKYERKFKNIYPTFEQIDTILKS